jgi:MFS family permease
MMSAALAWEIYERTNDELALGIIGLCRALPVVLMALPAGYVIDHANRKLVLVLTQLMFGVAAGAMALASHHAAPIWLMYALIVAAGLIRSFNGPVRSTLLPDIVSRGAFANAVTWNSTAFQAAAVGGPLLAGWMIQRTGMVWTVYVTTLALCVIFAVTTIFVHPHSNERPKTAMSARGMMAGLGHVYSEKLILSTLTLDLLAVLFGGAMALLPVYAKDILKVDALGYGFLRAAPYIGAFVMGLIMAHRPPLRRAGPTLLWCVAGFGVCWIVFGLSTNLWLSLAVLAISGALDNVSVVIRHVIVPACTPRELRGRVSAVNSVFIESSNELGGFESGAVAKAFGPVASVVSGGVGTLIVVAGVALAWPQLRRLGRLDDVGNQVRA